MHNIWMMIFKVMFLKKKDTLPYIIYWALFLLPSAGMFMKLFNEIWTALGYVDH